MPPLFRYVEMEELECVLSAEEEQTSWLLPYMIAWEEPEGKSVALPPRSHGLTYPLDPLAPPRPVSPRLLTQRQERIQQLTPSPKPPPRTFWTPPYIDFPHLPISTKGPSSSPASDRPSDRPHKTYLAAWYKRRQEREQTAHEAAEGAAQEASKPAESFLGTIVPNAFAGWGFPRVLDSHRTRSPRGLDSHRTGWGFPRGPAEETRAKEEAAAAKRRTEEAATVAAAEATAQAAAAHAAAGSVAAAVHAATNAACIPG